MKYKKEDWEEFERNAVRYLEINSQYATSNAVKIAIEKQIPKKPIIKTNLMTKHISAHCSICDTDITYYLGLESYCHNCGKALKWEEVEE